jgi:uncharacterized protein YukE
MWVDLEELQRFINTLQQFDDELADSVSKLSSHFDQLGDVWRDAKYQEFAAEWEEALLAISGYLDAAPDHVRFLQAKAAAVEEYLHG